MIIGGVSGTFRPPEMVSDKIYIDIYHNDLLVIPKATELRRVYCFNVSVYLSQVV